MLRLFCIGLLGLSIAACGSQPVNAPVGTRGIQETAKPAPLKRQPATGSTREQYTVRRGDTLYSIAWQHGLGYRELASLNGIRSPYTIFVGQQLRVAPSPPKRPADIPAAAKPEPLAEPSPIQADRPVQATEQPLPAVVSQWVWPAQGKLLRGFQPGAPGKKGVDISGRRGQPVMAAAAGKVVYTGSGLVGYGRLIIIKHNDSLLSAYGHNSKLLVKEGDRVKAGQVIAKMGSSGTVGTRLYFEIRKDGKPVNPLRYLPKG